MTKRAGPALSQQKRPLAKCQECHGRGLVRPLFYEMPCPGCHASGVVCAESGRSLTPDDLVLQLRIRLNERNEEVRQLRRELMEQRQAANSRGYGAAGGRYHGD